MSKTREKLMVEKRAASVSAVQGHHREAAGTRHDQDARGANGLGETYTKAKKKKDGDKINRIRRIRINI